jgi:hypothetical protein
LRALIQERGISFRALAAAAYVGRSYLHELATGAKVEVSMPIAMRIDDALAAGGELVALITADPIARESRALIELLDGGDRDEAVIAACAGAQRLAVAYLTVNPTDVLDETAQLRRSAVRALARAGECRAELLIAIGRLSGVLAYVALDLGDAAAARAHIDVTWRCGQATGHDGLCGWARGTQALIARFCGQYSVALELCEDGMHYAGPSDRVRLLCGQAQSHANMDDPAAARRSLAAAAAAHDDDEDQADAGLFGFTTAKLHYYGGSSLMWSPERADSARAAAACVNAIEAWARTPEPLRPRSDIDLAHVYLATARVRLGEVVGAGMALAPILADPDRHVSWIQKRLIELVAMLAVGPYRGDREAAELSDQIASATARRTADTD